jgi:aminocarboxymuconate-semialdehyde decarboxylase
LKSGAGLLEQGHLSPHRNLGIERFLDMRIIDSHFHWLPRSTFDRLCKSSGYPRCEADGKGGYRYYRAAGSPPTMSPWPEWFDLDDQFAYMDKLGYDVDVVSSTGPFSIYFSELPASEGAEAAYAWNEELAAKQRAYPGRFWGTAVVPLVDTATALEVLEHAANTLHLKGVNLPGSVGADPRIDHERLEPFYDRVEALGLPLLLHPTDAIFADMLSDGYKGALHLSLGRVVEVSVAAMRLVLSGIMERHPNLKLTMSHTGGALPYQAGRMDKNSKKANLPQDPSVYLRRMYTDTVSPHTAGMKFAIEFYGVDHVMYGSDYPCWMPADALRFLAGVGLEAADREKIMAGNARAFFNLEDAPAELVGRRELAAAP